MFTNQIGLLRPYLQHESISKNPNNTTSSSAAIEKLSPVFCRTKPLTDGHLDDECRYCLACLQFERFTLDARRGGIYKSNPHINFTAFCRSFNRSLEPPPSPSCHSNISNGSILSASSFSANRSH